MIVLIITFWLLGLAAGAFAGYWFGVVTTYRAIVSAPEKDGAK